MGFKLFFVFLSSLTFAFASEFLDSCLLSEISCDQRIETGIFHTYYNNGIRSCAENCMLTTDCYSFNIHKLSGVCELSSDTASNKLEAVIYSEDWMQSDISGWSKTCAGACSNVTCPPRHKCVYTTSGITTCLITECPPPPESAVNNSQIKPNSTKRGVGAISDYGCLPGYIGRGSPSATCKDDGSWTIPNLKCLKCPANWYQREYACYLPVLNSTAIFSDAKLYCENAIPGGHLAEIADMDENTFVSSLCKDHDTYIGAQNISGQWEWVKSKTPVTFFNWNPGEPNDVDHSDCLQIWKYAVPVGKWDDISCTFAKNFICEVELL